MDRKELEAKVLEAVAIAYNKDISEISLDTRFKEDLGGASIQMVGLISQIENDDDLGVLIQIPVASACVTIAEFVDKVEEEL